MHPPSSEAISIVAFLTSQHNIPMLRQKFLIASRTLLIVRTETGNRDELYRAGEISADITILAQSGGNKTYLRMAHETFVTL